MAHDLHGSLLGRCDTAKLRIARVSSVRDGEIQTVVIGGDALHTLAARAGLERPALGDRLPQPEMREPRHLPPPKFRHEFLPVWDAQKEALTTYRCIASLEQTAANAFESRARLELALMISQIDDTARRLTAHLAAGERFMMWLPLPFDVLTSAIGRMEIAGVCRNLSSDLRPYLIFEIVDLPEGVPQSRLNELAGSLRPFCRIVAAQLPIRTVNYSAYLGAGLQGIGISVAGCTATEISNNIMRLSDVVKKQQVMTFVLGVPRVEILQAARALGIQLLSGPLIGAPKASPAPIRRLSARSICQVTALPGVAA